MTMNKTKPIPLSEDILEQQIELNLAELCRACKLTAEEVVELVDEGVVEPSHYDSTHPNRWRFRALCVRRIYSAKRLQRDLGINTAGAALALDLLDELEQMRRRLKHLERYAVFD